MIPKPNRKTRIVTTSDGLRHLVSMDLRSWEEADWMEDHCGESIPDMADYCVRFRKDFPGDDLGTLLAYYIHCFMRDYHHAYHQLTNDNRPEAEWVTETK